MDRQCLHFLWLDAVRNRTIAEGRVPMARGATLAWFGFTDHGTPAIYTKAGLLSVLIRSVWVPVLQDTRQSNFVIGVSLQRAKLICVPPKSSEMPYPCSRPRPVPSSISLDLPLVAQSTRGLSAREQSSLLGTLSVEELSTAIDVQDADADAEAQQQSLRQKKTSRNKELLQLIQLACKSDRAPVAIDAASLLREPKAREAAAKVAARYQKTLVADAIYNLTVPY